MSTRSVEVSIVLVHYQVEEILWRCLKSIFSDETSISCEVIVVDNGSEAGFSRRLQQKFPTVQYIQARENLGYGAGNNLGVAQAGGQFVFILNPDTELQPGCLDILVTFLREHRRVGIVAPTLVHPDGEIFAQQGSLTLTPLRALAAHAVWHTLWPNNPIARKFWLTDLDFSHDRQVEVVPGSAFLIRRKVFEEVGGFDPQFFLYFEEYDLCRRVLDREYDVWMSGSAQVIHLWEATTGALPTTDISRRSFRLYLQKYYGDKMGYFWFLATQISRYQLIVFLLTFFTLLAWHFLG